MGLGTSKPKPAPSQAPPQGDAPGPDSNDPASLSNGLDEMPKSTPPTQIRNAPTRHHRTPSQPIAMPISPDVDRGISIAVSPSNGFMPTGVERIPTVFTWAHGGKQVAVTGTWSGWKDVFPLKRSTNDFTTILELPPGVHQYKFIVDGKWTHAPDQPVATDTDGNLNNYMDVKEFRLETKSIMEKTSPPGSYSQETPAMFQLMQDGPMENPFLRSPASFSHNRPIAATPPHSSSPYTYYSQTPTPHHNFGLSPSSSPAPGPAFKPSTSAPVSSVPLPVGTPPGPSSRERSKRDAGPPSLPPHLLRSRAVLNTENSEQEDPSVLPLPNHVMLNHLYQRDYDGNDDMKDVMILGTTVRYRDKFVTTVFYRPKPKADKGGTLPFPMSPEEDGKDRSEKGGGEEERRGESPLEKEKEDVESRAAGDVFELSDIGDIEGEDIGGEGGGSWQAGRKGEGVKRELF